MRYFILWLLPVSLGAEMMSSENYAIKTDVFNTGGGKAASTAYEVFVAVGQPTAIGEAAGTTYRARWGFLAHQTKLQVGVAEEPEKPLITRLYQNRPNPTKGGVTIPYSLAKASNVSLKVYDVTGRVVRTLINGRVLPGQYFIRWNGRDRNEKEVPAGVYFYRLLIDDKQTGTKKLVLVK